MPHIGQEIILNTLLRKGDFPGIIIQINPLTDLCVVKLDCQEEPVQSVLYYDKRPEVVNSTLWQICYPVDNPKG